MQARYPVDFVRRLKEALLDGSSALSIKLGSVLRAKVRSPGGETAMAAVPHQEQLTGRN